MTAISVVTTRAHFFVYLKFIKLRNPSLKLNFSKEEARVGYGNRTNGQETQEGITCLESQGQTKERRGDYEGISEIGVNLTLAFLFVRVIRHSMFSAVFGIP